MTGLRLQTWCSARKPTAAIGIIKNCSIRIPNVEVCVLHNVAFSTYASDTAFFQGVWSSEEETRLLLIIDELVREGKTDVSARGFWVSVSKALSGTRTPKQCRNKWCVLCSNHIIKLYLCNYAGLTRSEVRSKTKARPGAGKKKIPIF
jgi:hypothetical protein